MKRARRPELQRETNTSLLAASPNGGAPELLDDIYCIARNAWPVLIGQLALVAFETIDTTMVGRYSAVDLAALGLGASIYIPLYLAVAGVLAGLQQIVGRLAGKRRHEIIGAYVREAVWLAVILMVIGCAMLYYPRPFVHIAHPSEAVAQRTIAYLRILSFGLPAGLCFAIFSAFSNGISNPRPPMAILLIALIVKLPLNKWFIYGGLGVPALGGPGAALASTLAFWVAALISVMLIARDRRYRRYAVAQNFSWPRKRRQYALIRLGVPIGTSSLIEIASYTSMTLFIARFGTTVLAAQQIVVNLGAMLYMLPLSIGIATSTLVSQRIGAGAREAAHVIARRGVSFAATCATVCSSIILVARPLVVTGYTSNPQIIAAAMPLLTIVAFYHLADAVQVSAAFVLRAYGRTLVPTVIYTISLVGIGLCGGYLVGFGEVSVPWLPLSGGARGFWWANTVSLACAGIGLLTYWHSVATKPTQRKRSLRDIEEAQAATRVRH
ncbi:MATE family efflux transporter [Paraburkholderia solisilvae]|uniref:Multidrug-efflux transporter n=1 Tax=Paraburkholderia solisilvae TaxID=624376 RepID=A0A6J5DPT0_9BURK|nr:MATE family efflux transporter [Paraburkholderia solisilvae]CAB3756260.1 Multidrug resistance protein NorM [Paraburkholderia solisilvae]